MTHVLILLAACVVVPSVTIFMSIATMTAKGRLIRRPERGAALFAALSTDVREFIARHQLTLTDVLQYGEIPFAVFRMGSAERTETYLVVMRAGGRFVCDLVTDFGERSSLTTARHNSAFVHPRPPGAHMQAFPKATLEQLLDHHLAAELYLLDQGLVTPGTLEPDLAVRIERGLREQGAHIRRTPGFWWKAPWWFWVTRHRMGGKSVAQQVDRNAPRAASLVGR